MITVIGVHEGIPVHVITDANGFLYIESGDTTLTIEWETLPALIKALETAQQMKGKGT